MINIICRIVDYGPGFTAICMKINGTNLNGGKAWMNFWESQL